MFNVYASGRIEIPFAAMHGQYDIEGSKEELLMALNSLGLELPPDSIGRYPSTQISELLGDKLDRFLGVWEEELERIREGDAR